MNILCRNCGKDSGVESSESSGRDAAHVTQVEGWLARMPLLVGIDRMFFACSKECMRVVLDRAYAENNVSEEMLAKARAHTEECKTKIPQMAKETAEFMGRVQKALKPLLDRKKEKL